MEPYGWEWWIIYFAFPMTLSYAVTFTILQFRR